MRPVLIPGVGGELVITEWIEGRMVESLLYVAGALIAVYIMYGLVLLVLQPRLLYRPTREVEYTPADQDLTCEEASFTCDDGVVLTGWYVPAPKARLTVLFCHGNGGNIGHRLASVGLLHQLGLSCLVFDYRGYGRSGGRPSEAGTYRDARAAFDWLTRTKQIPPDRIIVFGRSLGGSVAAHLAGEVRPAALVVESAFTSYRDMVHWLHPCLPLRPFARFQYDTLAHVRKVRCPVMVVHSRYDALVPFDFGTRLFEAASEPKRFVEIVGGHNDGFLVSGEIYTNAWGHWVRFLAEDEAEPAGRQAC